MVFSGTGSTFYISCGSLWAYLKVCITGYECQDETGRPISLTFGLLLIKSMQCSRLPAWLLPQTGNTGIWRTFEGAVTVICLKLLVGWCHGGSCWLASTGVTQPRI